MVEHYLLSKSIFGQQQLFFICTPSGPSIHSCTQNTKKTVRGTMVRSDVCIHLVLLLWVTASAINQKEKRYCHKCRKQYRYWHTSYQLHLGNYHQEERTIDDKWDLIVFFTPNLCCESFCRREFFWIAKQAGLELWGREVQAARSAKKGNTAKQEREGCTRTPERTLHCFTCL